MPSPPHSRPAQPPTPPGGLRPYAWVNEDEREMINEALKACGGNKTRAAISLGLTPRQLRYRMSKLEIQL
jgi:Nif-specific regulatory protein